MSAHTYIQAFVWYQDNSLTSMMRTIIVIVNPKMNAEAKPGSRQPSKAAEPHKISSEALLGTNRQLVIVHNGREYSLRLTQNGKLILTA